VIKELSNHEDNSLTAQYTTATNEFTVIQFTRQCCHHLRVFQLHEKLLFLRVLANSEELRKMEVGWLSSHKVSTSCTNLLWKKKTTTSLYKTIYEDLKKCS
jgi:hypothetical protein